MAKNDLGITVKKDDDFTEWFTQLMIKSELADYSVVSGCVVFRPASYELWEKIVHECDKRFKAVGIRNAYFPLFIPESLFVKEEEHIEDFAPLVAWVTHGGKSKLSEKLAVRPTSEAIMYDSYAKWIRSWRDLPLRLNQWNNVVRWEFKHPVPFFRTREFLWNEGHSAFATEKEAMQEREEILAIYDEVCRDYMALPGKLGRKTEKEKFAGAVFSEKIHYYLQNGKVIEGPAFHYDGTNFAEAYDIKFKDKNAKDQLVYQNTYAITTRMLGTMLAMHSDDSGLVIPPKLAINKVVIIPILFDKTKDKVLKEANKLKEQLKEYAVILDDRDDISTGRKFNEWELRGMPLRIEIGPKDLEKGSVVVAKRNDNKKTIVKLSDVKKQVPKLLEKMQKEMFDKVSKLFDDNIVESDDFKKMQKLVGNKKVVIAPMCKNPECEDYIKAETAGAKTLFVSDKSAKGKKCIYCKKSADYYVYIGKTY